jgi:hypothetical protein
MTFSYTQAHNKKHKKCLQSFACLFTGCVINQEYSVYWLLRKLKSFFVQFILLLKGNSKLHSLCFIEKESRGRTYKIIAQLGNIVLKKYFESLVE